MKKLLNNKYLIYSLLILAGLLLGRLFFHAPHVESSQTSEVISEKEDVWTCAMHPHIRMDKPGKCSICAMDLIPLEQNAVEVDANAIRLTSEAASLANVVTSVVSAQKPVKEVRLYGKVQADERLLQSQVAHISGRIEKLYVNFTGESVSKGQELGVIYSSELITAQQELLEAIKIKDLQPEIYEAAKEKLRLWKFTDQQIATIENSGQVKQEFDILSNTKGIVLNRSINPGDYVQAGTVLFDVADLSNVWLLFDAYESDLPFLEAGDNLSFTLQALPGTKFSGKIAFIDAVIDPVTRVAKVRVETANTSGRLKPEMFATGIVKANLEQYRNNLIIPRSAVLWTGKRSVVYVKQTDTDEPIFKIREVGLGPMLGNSYVITDGLNEGEEIVTQGTFSIDAAAQLEGKPSMMNQQGGKTNTMPGMDMSGGAKLNNHTESQQAGNITNEKPEKTKVSMDFIMQLNTVFEQYIVLKDAFVQSDAIKVKQAAQNVLQALAKVDMKLLTGDAHVQWMEMLGKLDNQLKIMESSGKIEHQRIAFSEFSDQFYKTIKNFGLMGKTAYHQFCPMAKNHKGAYWISESKTIRNPYFGDKMMDCGETKETLEF